MKKITTTLLALLPLALPAMAVSIGGSQENYGKPPEEATARARPRLSDPTPAVSAADFKMAPMPQLAALRKEAEVLRKAQTDKETIDSITRLYAILDQPGVRQEISNRLWAKDRRLKGQINGARSEPARQFVIWSKAPGVYKDGIISPVDQWKATIRKLREDRARMRAQAGSTAKPVAVTPAIAEARSRAARAKPHPYVLEPGDVWTQWQVAILATWAAEADIGQYPAWHTHPDAPPKADKK